jgi:protein-S-isoprenylcysteine O-methyltransferase Ste14
MNRWGAQALWVFLTALPVFVVNQLPITAHASFGWIGILLLLIIDGIGFVLWFVGLSIEGIADLQKIQWQSKLGEKRHSEFINEGLWSLSRHPNYFGEGMAFYIMQSTPLVWELSHVCKCISAIRSFGIESGWNSSYLSRVCNWAALWSQWNSNSRGFKRQKVWTSAKVQ